MDTGDTYSRYHKALSLQVSRVLDGIGASQKRRDMRMNTFITNEIVHTLTHYQNRRNKNCFIFGSSSEGTATHGMNSDIDGLHCNEDLEIFQDISELPANKRSLLLVRDESTKPGYAKLQCSWGGMLLTASQEEKIEQSYLKADNKNRLVMCKGILKAHFKDTFERHGPAVSRVGRDGLVDTDFVQAYRCRTWPNIASDWLIRERHYSWPDEGSIEHMQSLGFFAVGVGHPHSVEDDIEWRVSLSLQERLLMFNLNSTQFKCYILLKMIKKYVLFPWIKEESISSYHLKTALFYQIENTPGDFWRSENLLACLQACLNRINKWTIDGYCPNYFIPEENMFERRMDDRLQVKLQPVLQQLLAADFMYLLRIRCDIFGTLLGHTCQQIPLSVNALAMFAGKVTTHLYAFAVRASTLKRNNFLQTCCSSTADRCVESLLKTVSKLRKVKTISNHTKEQTNEAVSLILPYVELSLMSNLVVQQLIHIDAEQIMMDYLVSNKWKEVRMSSDCFSANLKQATFMFMLGYFNASLEILASVESYDILAWSMCHCTLGRRRTLPRDALAYKVEKENISQEKFLRKYWAPCVVFLPTEKQLTPSALRYEMMRSSSMPLNSRNKEEFWYDWAVVDGKILLYFLLYLNYSKLAMRSKCTAYIAKMREIIESESFLAHKETDLNLLGWVLKQENQTVMASECFKSSLQLQKQHNAAILHLKDIDDSAQQADNDVTTLYQRL